VGLPGQQRPSERLWATPRRLADKPAPSLHSVRPQKKPRVGAGLVAYGGLPEGANPTDTIPQSVAHRAGDSHEKAPLRRG
jgi:hypothetical protein